MKLLTKKPICWPALHLTFQGRITVEPKWAEKKKTTWKMTIWMVQPFGKMVWHFLTKVNIHLSYGPAVPLLSIYPSEMKTNVHTKMCTQVIIVASIEKNSKNWQRARGPSSGGCTGLGASIPWKYYPGTNRNEPLLHVRTWMDLRCIMLRGRSQMRKGHDLLYDSIYVIFLKRKNYRNRKKKIKEERKKIPWGWKGRW